MKSIKAVWFCSLPFAVCLGFSAAADTVTYVPPHTEENALENKGKTLTLDESAYPVDADHALSFLGFEAVAESETVFKGGWWDFGAGSFLYGTAASDRKVTIQGGAMVSNVANLPCVNMWRNEILLKEQSTLAITGDAYVDYGGNNNRQCKLTVSDGSRLTVGGNVALGYTNPPSNSRWNSGSRFILTGSGSSAAAGNVFIGVDENNGSRTGGCEVWVEKSARLTTGNINIGGGNRCFDARLYVSDGGVVTAKNVNVGSNWPAEYAGAGDVLSGVWVLNGGELCVTNQLGFGYTSSANNGAQGFRFVISNGTVRAKSVRLFGSGIHNINNEVRIIGPDAKLIIGETINYAKALFGPATNNTFIVEGGAQYAFPWSGYSYTGVARCDSVVVQGASTKMTFGGLRTSGYASGEGSVGVSNRFVVANGALAQGDNFSLHGIGSELLISNATMEVTSTTYDHPGNEPCGSGQHCALTSGLLFTYGGTATNCSINLWGSSPRLRCASGASAGFRRATRLVFNLPASGYDADVVPVDVGNRLIMDESCSIEIEGASEMAEALASKPGMTQTLISAKTLVIPDTVLQKAEANLPSQFKLKLNGTAGSGQTLSLRRIQGLVLIFK